MSQPVLRDETSFILALGDAPLCKDQTHDTFVSYSPLEMNCNCASLLHDSAPTGFESVFMGLDITDVGQESLH